MMMHEMCSTASKKVTFIKSQPFMSKQPEIDHIFFAKFTTFLCDAMAIMVGSTRGLTHTILCVIWHLESEISVVCDEPLRVELQTDFSHY